MQPCKALCTLKIKKYLKEYRNRAVRKPYKGQHCHILWIYYDKRGEKLRTGSLKLKCCNAILFREKRLVVELPGNSHKHFQTDTKHWANPSWIIISWWRTAQWWITPHYWEAYIPIGMKLQFFLPVWITKKICERIAKYIWQLLIHRESLPKHACWVADLNFDGATTNCSEKLPTLSSSQTFLNQRLCTPWTLFYRHFRLKCIKLQYTPTASYDCKSTLCDGGLQKRT